MKLAYKKAILLITLCSTFMYISSQSTVDSETLYNRLFTGLNSPAAFDLSIVNSDGTFSTVIYPTVQPTDFTGEPRSHLYLMNDMARAYQTPGPQYKSQEVLQAYVKTWNWWFSFDPKDSNWWYRSIGWPNTLYPSFVLMAKDMKTYYPAEYQTMVNYLLFEWTPEKVALYKSDPDGANTTDITYYTLATAIASENDSVIAQTCDMMTSLINIQTTPNGEGIQPDYSFTQHSSTGRQLYMGNYGKEYMGAIIKFATLTDDTFFETPADKMTIFENLFLEGISWIAYRNIFDHHQHGRRVVETDGYPKSMASMYSLIQLNTPQKTKLQELYDWMSRNSESNETNIQQGNRMYWRHDYMVHKGMNYFTTNRMSSTRVMCSETMNGEGLNNYYTGSGVNYIYLTGQEYLEIWDDMNWRRLPGITTPQKPTSTALPTAPPIAKRSLNEDAFAGGTSDGKTGVSGFIFNKTVSEINVSLNKSCFYFDDYFVVLGANIKAGKDHGYPIATTINQVKFKDVFLVDNNGTQVSMENNQTLVPTKSNWAYLNNIGYQFLTNTKLNYEVKTIGASPLAWLSFNHGNLPTSDQYAYAVYPNVNQTELMEKLIKTPFTIVSNTSTVQCVADTSKKIVQAIFYKAFRLNLPGNLGFVETNQPAAIQLRWHNDSVFISVANPYCESITVSSIIIKLGGLFAGEFAVDDKTNQLTTITMAMPVNEFQGSTVSVGLKNKVVSGMHLISSDASVLKIYPNMMNAGTTCSFLNPDKNKNPSKITIFNTSGSIIREFRASPDHSNRIWIDTKGLNQGIYFVKHNSMVGKIIIK